MRGEATRVLGGFLRDVMKESLTTRNFRVFGPDETASNRLGALFEVTDRGFGLVVGVACRRDAANVVAADADVVVKDLLEMMP